MLTGALVERELHCRIMVVFVYKSINRKITNIKDWDGNRILDKEKQFGWLTEYIFELFENNNRSKIRRNDVRCGLPIIHDQVERAMKLATKWKGDRFRFHH